MFSCENGNLYPGFDHMYHGFTHLVAIEQGGSALKDWLCLVRSWFLFDYWELVPQDLLEEAAGHLIGSD